MSNNDSSSDFASKDLFGYWFNSKYPPNPERYGLAYGGYETTNQDAFFYEFCIQQYGVAFYYKSQRYEAQFVNIGPILTNLTTGEVQGPFEDAMILVETAKIDGKNLIDIIDDLEEIVLH